MIGLIGAVLAVILVHFITHDGITLIFVFLISFFVTKWVAEKWCEKNSL